MPSWHAQGQFLFIITILKLFWLTFITLHSLLHIDHVEGWAGKIVQHMYLMSKACPQATEGTRHTYCSETSQQNASMLLILELETFPDSFSRCAQDHLLILWHICLSNWLLHLHWDLQVHLRHQTVGPPFISWHTGWRGHSVNFDKAEVIASNHASWRHIIRECTEICKHPHNFNLQDGCRLCKTWLHLCYSTPVAQLLWTAVNFVLCRSPTDLLVLRGTFFTCFQYYQV